MPTIRPALTKSLDVVALRRVARRGMLDIFFLLDIVLIDVNNVNDHATFSARANQRPQGLRNATAAPDNLAQVVRIDLELNDRPAIAFTLANQHTIGLGYEPLGQKLQQVGGSGLRRQRIRRLPRHPFTRNESLAASIAAARARRTFVLRFDLVDNRFAGRDLARP
jgi:hypothetical protein